MTSSPQSISREQTLSEAVERMRRFGLSHLPVLDGGRIVGVLSAREVAFVEALRDVDPSKATVEDALSTDVYAVAPDAPLVDITREMAEHKYECVVVIDHGHVEGIFTFVDAIRVLGALLERAADGRSVASGKRP